MGIFGKIVILWVVFVLFALLMKKLTKNYKIKIPTENEENPYLKGVNYIKRSELTDEDLQRLKKERDAARKREEIIFSAYSIQELRYLIAEHWGVNMLDVQMVSPDKIFIEEQPITLKWRYRSNGIVEYYKPAEDYSEEPYVYDNTEEYDEYIWEHENQISDSFDNQDFSDELYKGNVIKGPW